MATSAETKNGKTDSATAAQNRFVVSLPAEVGGMIDEVGVKLSAAFERETGVAFELSRAQIVQALVRQALKQNDDAPADTDAEQPAAA